MYTLINELKKKVNRAICQAEIYMDAPSSFISDSSGLRFQPSGGGMTFQANYFMKTKHSNWGPN